MNLYVQADTLLPADVFQNFRNIYPSWNIYELDPARFLTTPGWAWQVALRKTKIKLDLLADVGTLLMVEKCGRICNTIHWYTKSNNKYMKIIMKIKNHHILSIGA